MQISIQDASVQPLQVMVAGKLYAAEEIPGPVAVVLEGTTIRDIWRGTDAATAMRRLTVQMPDATVEVTDLGSWCLAPGFIDLHTHGFCGHDVTTGSQDDVEAMARELPCTGETSFFPTIATLDRPETKAHVQTITSPAQNQVRGAAAEILGMRLERLLIRRAEKCAQYEPLIR